MTFDELKKRVPNAAESEWHHHDKGGGGANVRKCEREKVRK